MPDFRPRIRTTRSPDEWRQQIADLRGMLGACGLPVPPGSRIDAFALANEQFIRNEISASDGGDGRLHRLLSGARDVSELYAAATGLLPTADPTLLGLFRKALGGSALPTNENRIARTSQFELYMGALLKQAGATVSFAEPDLLISWRGHTWGVACKRLESQAQYAKRLRKGANQLLTARARGLVAVSFDYVADGSHALVGDSIPELGDRSPALLESVVEPLAEVTWNVLRGRPALALFASVVVPAVVPGTNGIGRLASALMRIIEPNVTPEERKALIALTDHLASPPRE